MPGPEKAIAMIVSQALSMSNKAAQQSGVKLTDQIGKAAMKEIVTAVASMMAAAGIVKDVNATVASVMQMVGA